MVDFDTYRMARAVVDADECLEELGELYCVHCDYQYPEHDDACIVDEAKMVIKEFEDGAS